MVEYALVRLWADRVRLVKRHLASPTAWPDGIDTKYERWHEGREDYWTNLAANLDDTGKWVGGLEDMAAYKRYAAPRSVVGRAVAEGPVSAAERMRRYRERRKAK